MVFRFLFTLFEPMKNDSIPIIDLFAGPGGLGEGFSALKCNIKNSLKKITSLTVFVSSFMDVLNSRTI